MTKESLACSLLQGIERADSRDEDMVYISKKEAKELLRLLTGNPAETILSNGEDGQKLFYCHRCGKSFWAAPQENEESFAKWRYHVWNAECPLCGRKTELTDIYWR